MLGCFKDSWRLLCKKQYKSGHISFNVGEAYEVKDKFPGEDKALDSGYWEVKDGRGGLISLSKEEREKYFIEI